MSKAAEIFSEQDWSKFYKDLLVEGLSDSKIESYCDYMQEEFEIGFNDHLRECQGEADLQDSFSRIAAANLKSDYRTVLHFFFFQYHIDGHASLDILNIVDTEVKKWLNELLDYVNNSADWGKCELYEFSRTRSILNDILFSEETDEFRQENTATDEELEMLDEGHRIYGERCDLLEQCNDYKHRRAYLEAEKDLNDIIERVHKRINYVEVEDDIFMPAMYILKEYALSTRIHFDMELVRTSILKINHWFNVTEINDKLTQG